MLGAGAQGTRTKTTEGCGIFVLLIVKVCLNEEVFAQSFGSYSMWNKPYFLAAAFMTP